LPLAVTAAVIVGVAAWRPSLVGVVVILGILEVSFSFDNAVVNAKILAQMPASWQRVFLTVGVLIAVVGMRLLFPLIVVSLGGHMSPLRALSLGVNEPKRYQQILTGAHPAVISFGGIFLLMIFLDWVLEKKDPQWLRPLESMLERLGRLDQVSVVIALLALASVSQLAAPGKRLSVIFAGTVGLVAYLVINMADSYFEQEEGVSKEEVAVRTQVVSMPFKVGLATFLYHEVLDASFSFDGVMGAFAVTTNIFAIMIGLGIGALFVRTLTVYLVNKGTLRDYIYVDHGAHWAIGALAAISLYSIKYAVSEYVTGLIGVAFITAAVVSSIFARCHQADETSTVTT
jgi:hypothetical protein